MEKGKTILVTGATGQQGGATIRQLLARGWSVRAITRNPDKSAAQALRRAGVEVFHGDNDNRDSLEKAMRGVYGVFSIQPTEFSPGMGPDFGYDDEVRLGMKVADAAKKSGVEHFIYSSVGGVENLVGSRNYSKWEIEQYIRNLNLPITILRPVWFMENFTDPLFGLQSGTLSTAIAPNASLELIAVDDIGAFCAIAFDNPDRYLGTTIEIAGDSLTPSQIAASISRTIAREISYIEIPIDAIRQINPNAAKTFELINNKVGEVDITALRQLHPSLMTFNEWLHKTGKVKFETLFQQNMNC